MCEFIQNMQLKFSESRICKIHATLIHKPVIQNNNLHGHVTHGSQLIIPKYHAYLTLQMVTQNKYTLYVTALNRV